MERLIRGESMRPFLRPMDKCVTGPVSVSDLVPGDIVIYVADNTDEPTAHRIISLDRAGEKAYIKGDNIPSDHIETVPLSLVKEKVIGVERNGKTISLDSPFRKALSRGIACMSSHDLTPMMIKRRFIDPILLGISRSEIFKKVMAVFMSENIEYSAVSMPGGRKHLYALFKRNECARMIFDQKEGRVIISSYVRHRFRNDRVARSICVKCLEFADREFGRRDQILLSDTWLAGYVRDRFDPELRGRFDPGEPEK